MLMRYVHESFEGMLPGKAYASYYDADIDLNTDYTVADPDMFLSELCPCALQAIAFPFSSFRSRNGLDMISIILISNIYGIPDPLQHQKLNKSTRQVKTIDLTLT